MRPVSGEFCSFHSRWKLVGAVPFKKSHVKLGDALVIGTCIPCPVYGCDQRDEDASRVNVGLQRGSQGGTPDKESW